MGVFAVGDIVLVPFPYSDRPTAAVRPALIVQRTDHGDFLICMITTQGYGDSRIVPISGAEQEQCGLIRASVVRYSKIATIAGRVIIKKLGAASPAFILDIKDQISRWISE